MSRGFRWALALVVVTTVTAVVSGVRSQTGTGGLWLTVGRELRLMDGDNQNSDRSFVWVWGQKQPRRQPAPADSTPMIPGRTLEELGLPADSIARRLARERFVVLTLVEPDSAGASRLSVADAGRDLGALETRYPDRDRYLIVPATVASWRVVGNGVSLFVGVNPPQLHLPTEVPLGRDLLVRSGRKGVPYIAESRP